MRSLKVVAFCAGLFLATGICWAVASGAGPKVFSEKGNIYYSEDGENKVQLTKSGEDREPVLSPNGEAVVFIRKTKDGKDELWLIKLDAGKQELLVKEITYPSKDGPEKKPLTRIVADGIHFSPDSKTIYLVSRDFETSGGIHSVEIESGKERYVTDGSELKVISSGKYEGHLIFRQHRYFLFGPSYDWIWLYTPDGKEVGPVAEDWDGVDWDRLSFEEK